MSKSQVVTRFAPSPTGFLHIGGARTALFNWLYARHTGGTFLLRIEDTDRVRSTDAAVAAIFDGLRWLGIDWDGEPVMQFARSARHAEVADEMIARGMAFRCYVSAEELEQRRERVHILQAKIKALQDKAKKSASLIDAEAKGGKAAVGQGDAEAEPLSPTELTELRESRDEATKLQAPFRSPYRDVKLDAQSPNAPFSIRLRAPDKGDIVVEDRVQGTITWASKDLDDMVLLRSDGTPTYMLAVVVDDHDMGVTHVIRGDDHLTNAARQSLIYNAMGWDIPAFAHIPLIHGADGAKLSKRHGALGIDAYRTMGFLPDGLRNYLARLGWAHGDDEIFSTQQAAQWFDLDAIGRSPSRFDFVKLENLNAHYIRETDNAALVALIRDILPEILSAKDLTQSIDEPGWDKLALAMPGLKERAKTLVELISGARYLFAARPLTIDEKAAKLLTSEARSHLSGLHKQFGALETWNAGALEATTRAYADEANAKLGTIAQPLRAVLTGSAISPPVFDVAYVLGRDETLARIADQLNESG